MSKKKAPEKKRAGKLPSNRQSISPLQASKPSDEMGLIERQEPVELEHALQAPSHPFSIVGIGASAGGFEAFGELLRQLPVDTGMAFVLVQHLDPTHESQLSELLSRNSPLPVREVKNGVKVEPNHLYSFPQTVSLRLLEGHLQLTPRASKGPHLPIDCFFRSLAQEVKEQAIGVVLSGNGSDGTLGLQEIKAAGGITFAQDETTAKFFGMPGSAIGAGCVDFILPVDGIAQELGRIAKHPFLGAGSADTAKRK